MRRLLLIAALLTTMVITSADTASAAQYAPRGRTVVAQRTGPIARLVELERRAEITAKRVSLKLFANSGAAMFDVVGSRQLLVIAERPR